VTVNFYNNTQQFHTTVHCHSDTKPTQTLHRDTHTHTHTHTHRHTQWNTHTVWHTQQRKASRLFGCALIFRIFRLSGFQAFVIYGVDFVRFSATSGCTLRKSHTGKISHSKQNTHKFENNMDDDDENGGAPAGKGEPAVPLGPAMVSLCIVLCLMGMNSFDFG
jgi:hypothetical protein